MKCIYLMLLALLAGCVSVEAKVVVVWTSPDNMHWVCGGGAAACVRGNVIYAPEPKNFDDDKALCLLGHELYHILGGKHIGRETGCPNHKGPI